MIIISIVCVVKFTGMSSYIEGGVYRRRKIKPKPRPKPFMEENKEPIRTAEDESDEETQPVDKEQSVPLLLNKEDTTKNASQTTIAEGTTKHILIIREDDDSGISETASEELGVLTEPPRVSVSEQKEGFLSVIVQIFIPYIIAGFGMMSAGFLLDYVQVH